MIRRASLLTAVALLFAAAASATTFVVPSDRYMVAGSKAIVVAKVVTSATELTDTGSIETVTTIEIEEVLKGKLDDSTLKVHAPGGSYGDRTLVTFGTPRFRDGEKVLLFLVQPKADRWVVLNLLLGKFTRATDREGRKVAMRQEADISGWTIDGTKHDERRRDSAKFIDFIRAVVSGTPIDEEAHFLPVEEKHPGRAAAAEETPEIEALATGQSYVQANARWPSFPRTFTHTNTISNATNGGVNAITTAMGLWNDDSQSSVNLVHGGLDASKTAGVFGNDGANAIRWEVDLSIFGPGAYSCAQGGLLGIAQIWMSGSHAGPGGTYTSIIEGDVDMNHGQNACASHLASNTFVLGLTHEVGHAIGFRHADQNPDGSSPCVSPNDCVPVPSANSSTHAIMRSSIANGLSLVLQPWDQSAVRTVYPTVADTTPSAPTGVTATATSATSVTVNWSAPAGTVTGYRVVRNDGVTINLGLVTNYVDNAVAAGSAYHYIVRALNNTAVSVDSNRDFAVPMSYTDSSISTSTVVKAIHFTQLRAGVNALRVLAGLGATTFTDTTLSSTVTIKVAHLTELRTNLNAARLALGGSSVTFGENVTTSTTTKVSHITEIRNGLL